MPLIGVGALWIQITFNYIACDDRAGHSPTKSAEDHTLPVYNCIPHNEMQLQEIWTRLFKSLWIMPIVTTACVQDGR